MVDTAYDERFMKIAIKEAQKCKHGMEQFPIGAVVVKNGEIISRGHSKDKHTNNPTDHAEIIALIKACKKLGRQTLSDCTLFSTAEPCQMCLSVIFQTRVQEIVYGAPREKLPMRKKSITIEHLLKDAGYEVLLTAGVLESKCLALFRQRKLLPKK
jgi:tRNA(adenine34) deaminase